MVLYIASNVLLELYQVEEFNIIGGGRPVPFEVGRWFVAVVISSPFSSVSISPVLSGAK